jgi:heat shock protein HslJ
VLAAFSAAGSVHAASDRAELFGRGYVSTAVLKDGERQPLFEETKVRVDLNHRDNYDNVTWRADCNYFGAPVEVTDERLVIGEIAGTDMGCSGDLLRRDRWMLRFFRSDPKWRIRRDDRLKLTAGDRVIRLRKLTSPPRGR